ncbi:uncharacterized protein ASCRUDRAFT_127089 [Ascoidea rubescens DSM 1968]|uniref:Uncharacterized protein n=1 Tax=Ascoidea rubescens DSM 1968 TaxID=1344418 RepID=A0A1D2VND1_9ASCO|nr:hypothetical protein ASCRUDRAFT_127089 [Ascoidea rubescens DSM 1968]ODV63094.1 hypothetical protein ASCRUDRAFT_127089 [Ascoidea rubescens DSM 1968]
MITLIYCLILLFYYFTISLFLYATIRYPNASNSFAILYYLAFWFHHSLHAHCYPGFLVEYLHRISYISLIPFFYTGFHQSFIPSSLILFASLSFLLLFSFLTFFL